MAPEQIQEEPQLDTPESILGVDPTEEVSEPVAEEAAEEEPAEDTPPEYSPEDIQTWQQKARVFDMLDNDPKIAGVIAEYFKTGKLGQFNQPQGEEQQEQPANNGSKEVVELRNMVRNLQAELRVDRFSRAHPDFEEMRNDIGQLIHRHPTYSLEDAYNEVKARRARTQPAPLKQNVRSTAAAETVSRPAPNRGRLDALRQKLNDPKQTKNFDQVFDTALEIALTENSGEE